MAPSLTRWREAIVVGSAWAVLAMGGCGLAELGGEPSGQARLTGTDSVDLEEFPDCIPSATDEYKEIVVRGHSDEEDAVVHREIWELMEQWERVDWTDSPKGPMETYKHVVCQRSQALGEVAAAYGTDDPLLAGFEYYQKALFAYLVDLTHATKRQIAAGKAPDAESRLQEIYSKFTPREQHVTRLFAAIATPDFHLGHGVSPDTPVPRCIPTAPPASTKASQIGPILGEWDVLFQSLGGAGSDTRWRTRISRAFSARLFDFKDPLSTHDIQGLGQLIQHVTGTPLNDYLSGLCEERE